MGSPLTIAASGGSVAVGVGCGMVAVGLLGISVAVDALCCLGMHPVIPPIARMKTMMISVRLNTIPKIIPAFQIYMDSTKDYAIILPYKIFKYEIPPQLRFASHPQNMGV
jgi:hypothetical protein